MIHKLLKQIQPLDIAKAITILMLLWALAPHPYAYYQVLRWIVAGVCGYAAYKAHEDHQIGWTWVMTIIVILFNPIASFYFQKGTWGLLDVLAAIAILINIFYKKI